MIYESEAESEIGYWVDVHHYMTQNNCDKETAIKSIELIYADFVKKRNEQFIQDLKESEIKMTKYKCVKPLTLDTYGDDGFPVENERFVVEIDSVWEVEETSYRFAASADSTRLTNAEGRWMEIHDEDLTDHFAQI